MRRHFVNRAIDRLSATERGRQVALSNTELRYYDGNVLRLPADKRKEYHAQVDRLITELCKRVRDKTEIKITKVVKAVQRRGKRTPLAG